MISKIVIDNFQKHKHIEIDVDSPILTIIGESDKGKSSIIRALMWVLTNKVDDGNFIRWGENECSVELNVDGHIVKRLKSKSKNIYLLDGQEYACLRGTVPDDVQRVLKISDNSIQKQEDLFFWFNETGGELAKKLNSIVDLEIVDYTFASLQAQIRDVKSVRDVYEGRLKTRQPLLEKYEKLSLVRKIFDSTAKYKNLMNLKNSQIKSMETKLSMAADALKRIERWTAVEAKYDICETLYGKLRLNSEKTKGLQKIIDDVKKCSSSVFPDELNGADELNDEFNTLKEVNGKVSRLNGLLKSASTFRDDCRDIEKMLKDRIKKLGEYCGGICPVCGKALKDNELCLILKAKVEE